MQFARFLAPALVLSIAVVARADDAKTYDLGVKPVFKVGELTTETFHDGSTTDITVAGADGAPLGAHNEQELAEFTATHKVLELDANGRVAKQLIHFSAWKYVKGDAQASELTGAHLEVSGRGPSRAWKLLTPDVTVTPPTKGWLDKQYGPSEEKEEFSEVVKPSKPVAIGESWDLDVARVAAGFGKSMQLDLPKSSAKATLASVEGDVATVHVELKLQAASFPGGPGGPVKILEGGVFDVVGEGHLPLAETARGDEGSMAMKLSVKTEGEKKSTVTVVVEGAKQVSKKAGGEMPEVPAAK